MHKGLRKLKFDAGRLAAVLALIVAVRLPLTAQERLQAALPAEIESPVNNPYMGWGLWTGAYNDFTAARYAQPLSVSDNTTSFGDDAPLFSWVLLDWPWVKVEPHEGEFDWREFDAIVNYWAVRGKVFFVRFWVTDDPGWNGKSGGVPCPDWLWQKGVSYREYTGNGGVRRREPDYADPSFKQIYLPALQDLLRAFAARYDRPGTPIGLLQVMGYGHWADWATWYSHYQFPSLDVKHAILAAIMNTYIPIFRHIQLVEMADTDWNAKDFRTLEHQLYTKALDVALEHRFGLLWTGFIDGLGGWNRDIKDRYWRDDPIIAEGNWCYEDMKSQKIHGTPGENLDKVLDWHANYAHFYTDATAYKWEMSQDRDFLERGLRSGGLGYRLAPASLSWAGELPAGHLMVVRQTWVNRNVGRLYLQHPLRLYLTDQQGVEKFSEVDTSFDERGWVKGEQYNLISVFHLPKSLPTGTYDVRIALVDEKGKPRIALAIEDRDAEGRYRIGRLRVLPYDGPVGCGEGLCP